MKKLFFIFFIVPSFAHAGNGGLFVVGRGTVVFNNNGSGKGGWIAGASSGGGGCNAPGTAIAFRATANDTAATQIDDTVNKPAGTVDNDVMVAICHLESDTPSLTPPAGWTLAVSTKNTVTTPDTNSFLYFKRASSEGSSYVFTHASAFSQCAIASYSGVNTGCGPLDTGQSTNTFTANTIWTGKSINTTYTNNMLILTQDDFDGLLSSPPLSPAFTERLDTSQISMNDFSQAASGPSGDASGSFGATANGGVCFVSLID